MNVAISYYRKEKRRQSLNQPLSDRLLFLVEDTPIDDVLQSG
ncbi:hypothetical protein [Spirosoma gilvum]